MSIPPSSCLPCQLLRTPCCMSVNWLPISPPTFVPPPFLHQSSLSGISSFHISLRLLWLPHCHRLSMIQTISRLHHLLVPFTSALSNTIWMALWPSKSLCVGPACCFGRTCSAFYIQDAELRPGLVPFPALIFVGPRLREVLLLASPQFAHTALSDHHVSLVTARRDSGQ